MSNIELALTNLGEAAVVEFHKKMIVKEWND